MTNTHAASNTPTLDEWCRLNLNLKGQPHAFHLHSERILFALQNGLNQFLAGALQDLFIALGTQGRPLRQRMFSLVIPLIDQYDREYFHEWLAHDSDQTLSCYRALGAVLISHTCQADTTRTDAFIAQSSGTTLEQSHDAIANGRIEIAQTLLTQAINNTNTTPDINLVDALLTLLAATRQKNTLTNVTNALQQQSFILSKHWKQVLESSKEW